MVDERGQQDEEERLQAQERARKKAIELEALAAKPAHQEQPVERTSEQPKQSQSVRTPLCDLVTLIEIMIGKDEHKVMIPVNKIVLKEQPYGCVVYCDGMSYITLESYESLSTRVHLAWERYFGGKREQAFSV